MAKIIGGQPLYDYDSETRVYVPGARELKIVVIGGGHGQSHGAAWPEKFHTEFDGNRCRFG